MSTPPDTPRVIGLAGRAGSGKSTVASLAMRHSDTFVYTRAFADPLKQIACILFGLEDDDVNTTEGKETPIPELGNLTPRVLLQRLGTDLFRNHWHRVFPELGPDSPWVAIMRRNLRRTHPRYGTVVPDVRFPDEANLVRDVGGLVVEVVRPGQARIASSAHISERGVGADRVLANDGSLTRLGERVQELLAELERVPPPASRAAARPGP
jgi:hypothetical protein